MYGGYADVTGPAVAEDMLKLDYKGDFELPEDASASLKRQVEASDAFIWLNEPESIPGCVAASPARDRQRVSFTLYPADNANRPAAGRKGNQKLEQAPRGGGGVGAHPASRQSQ